MDEANAMAQHQQALLQRQQQQFLLLQQSQQHHHHHHHHHQQQNQQQEAISRLPPNTGVHSRGSSIQRLLRPQQQRNPNPSQRQRRPYQHQRHLQHQQHQQLQQQETANRPGNQFADELIYEDTSRVCHPDINQPFLNFEDACERLLPYHVLEDLEAEKDGILESDTTRQMFSSSQQWDHNLAGNVADFTATFEKQVQEFNSICRKRGAGEFCAEERLMIEQALLQDEKQALYELTLETESRKKVAREATEAEMQMSATVQPHAEAQFHSEMLAGAPCRANGIVSQVGESSVGRETAGQELEANMESFLNDEKKPENDETGIKDK